MSYTFEPSNEKALHRGDYSQRHVAKNKQYTLKIGRSAGVISFAIWPDTTKQKVARKLAHPSSKPKCSEAELIYGFIGIVMSKKGAGSTHEDAPHRIRSRTLSADDNKGARRRLCTRLAVELGWRLAGICCSSDYGVRELRATDKILVSVAATATLR
ncbi:predicted protein [Uncinocarpus reesii 1704]|uniref:Uncharacterized protein n=1 Tax=Uncinocarpus reesii (strain UAMH 1704) TaxID=336963 RepID=C4JGD1_UNCRE|nr:uncharacterized protein UREG_01122 [Uncinocarpus reesii 1704]EEP76273.1 predicted protein [Uncinocarpus reesii 1704]